MSNEYTRPPVPNSDWTDSAGIENFEKSTLLDYGQACADSVAQVKDGRIAELEAEVIGVNTIRDCVRRERDRLRAEVEALRLQIEGAAKTRAPKPRTLAQRGTGALHGEQQYCFEMGYREGALAVRKAIAKKVAAIDAARAAQQGGEDE